MKDKKKYIIIHYDDMGYEKEHYYVIMSEQQFQTIENIFKIIELKHYLIKEMTEGNFVEL